MIATVGLLEIDSFLLICSVNIITYIYTFVNTIFEWFFVHLQSARKKGAGVPAPVRM